MYPVRTPGIRECLLQPRLANESDSVYRPPPCLIIKNGITPSCLLFFHRPADGLLPIATDLFPKLLLAEGVFGHLFDLSLAGFGVLSVGFAEVGSFSHKMLLVKVQQYIR